MSQVEHTFAMLGAPTGHRQCKLRILDERRREFACECAREFDTRFALEDHHRTEATLIASVLLK